MLVGSLGWWASVHADVTGASGGYDAGLELAPVGGHTLDFSEKGVGFRDRPFKFREFPSRHWMEQVREVGSIGRKDTHVVRFEIVVFQTRIDIIPESDLGF